MKTKKFFFYSVFLASLLITLGSCQKENSSVIVMDETDVTLAEDDALAETVFDDIMVTVDNAVMNTDNLLFKSNLKSAVISDSCPLVTVDRPDTVRWPKVITIDYGDGCEGFFGRTRSGKIKITITARYRVEGSTKTVELINYTINGLKVKGTKVISNDGRNESGNLTFTVQLTDGKVMTEDDEVIITREFTRTREWATGERTFNRWDDVYFITGSSSGINIKGKSYTRTITNPLVKAASCVFIQSGTVVREVEGRPTSTLDYGDGKCDNEASLTIGDKTKTILLKHKRTRKP
jgi:hypothetical protein